MSRTFVEQFLAPSGVTLNGPHRYDPLVHDDSVFDRLFMEGPVMIGESYMDGAWDADDLSEMFYRIVRFCDLSAIYKLGAARLARSTMRAFFLNLQNRIRSREVALRHYDIGNDLYENMLDRRLTYSCGYWQGARTLDDAQEAKLDLICKKISIQPGDRILDIGCGWGSFAIYAAEKYGAEVTGVTISREQVAYAADKAKKKGVEIRLQDYRDIKDGPFDKIVSIGMFEHVGPKNYRAFMRKVRSLIKEDGLFLLHTIGAPQTTRMPDPWIDRYIFPNGFLPSAAQITAAADNFFVLEDWHNFGVHYDKTLCAWLQNFEAAWPSLRKKYDERFYRMWKFYLSSCAGSFRARGSQLWQIVFSPKGTLGGYASIR